MTDNNEFGNTTTHYNMTDNNEFGNTTTYYNMTDNFNFITKTIELVILSYNMHGFHQGFSTVLELIKSNVPDIFMLQEHWRTPDNMLEFDQVFPDYIYTKMILSYSVLNLLLYNVHTETGHRFAGLTVPYRAGLTVPYRAGLTVPYQAGLTVPYRAGLTVPYRAGLTVP